MDVRDKIIDLLKNTDSSLRCENRRLYFWGGDWYVRQNEYHRKDSLVYCGDNLHEALSELENKDE